MLISNVQWFNKTSCRRVTNLGKTNIRVPDVVWVGIHLPSKNFERQIQSQLETIGTHRKKVWELREARASFSVSPEVEQDLTWHDMDLDGNTQASDSGSINANTRHLQAFIEAPNPSTYKVHSIPSFRTTLKFFDSWIDGYD